MLWIIGVAIITGVVMLSRIDDWSRDFTTNVAATGEASKLKPLQLTGTVEVAVERVRNAIAGQSHWQWIDQTSNPDGEVTINLVRSTALFGFKDDVQVLITPHKADEGVLLNVVSRSRVGKGDLGQNPRNIKELLACIENR